MKTLWPARLPAQRRCVQALEQAAAGALLAAAMVLAPTALAQQPGALGSGSIYTCIDSQGRKLTSDRPIGACIDREQRELGPSGTTVRRVLGPTLTDHERAAQEAQRRQAQEERSRVQEERRRDRVMLARYPDAATHNVERTAAVALLLALAKRSLNSKSAAVAARVATLGYGIPGTVLAVGVFVPVAWLDNYLVEWLRLPEGSAILKGTLLVMLLAYVIRFLAVAYSANEAGLERIGRQQEETARSLGVTGFALLRRVHLPLLKGALGTAMLMVFVDVMKEMPITLMTRPYNWDTLATRVYTFTTEGQYTFAALPSLAMVLTGLLPVILFSRLDEKKNA